jgi:tetratricopeptide (TPR) repeat protein
MAKKVSKKSKKKQLSQKKAKDSPRKATVISFWKDKTKLLLLLAVLVVTFITFSDALNNTWVSWDDDRNFMENELVQGINASNFGEFTVKIFKADVIGGYNPLTTWTFALEKMAFGMEDDDPRWWHLNNILLHLLCVYLVYRIALLLKLKPIPAALVALLFGIHPLRVESVAWLTERKDVLFASFYFGAIFYYIKGKLKGKDFGYSAIIIPLFILSLFSKIQAVSLPLTLIAVDYYITGKFEWKSILTKAHFFLLSLIVGFIGFSILSGEGVTSDNTGFSFLQRLFVGSYSYMTYLVKLIYPYEMSPLYPYPSSFENKFYLSAIPFFMLVGGIVYAWMKKAKVWVFGFLFFTFNVMFVLQIIGAGQGFIADRFTYVPYFGLFFIAAYYYQKLNLKSIIGKVISGLIAAYMLMFCWMTYNQVGIWRNSYSLWTHTIGLYPKTKVTWGNRANWLRDNGYKELALADYSKRLSLGADDPEPFNSRGKLYFQSQRSDTLQLALADYKTAVSLARVKAKTIKKYEDRIPEYLVNLGSVYARLGYNAEAIKTFNEAETYNPSNRNIYYNRSITYHNLGDYSAEIRDINSYLNLNPYDGNMLVNLGSAYRLTNQFALAENAFFRARKYTQSPALFIEEARNYMAQGKTAQAAANVSTLRQNGVQIPADLAGLGN